MCFCERLFACSVLEAKLVGAFFLPCFVFFLDSFCLFFILGQFFCCFFPPIFCFFVRGFLLVWYLRPNVIS